MLLSFRDASVYIRVGVIQVGVDIVIAIVVSLVCGEGLL